VHVDRRHARGREQAEVGGAQRPPRRREHVARARLLARVQHAVAGRHAPQQLDVAGHRLGRVLDHHDRVGAVRQQPAGRDRHRGAGTDRPLGRAPHHDRAADLEERGQRLRRPIGVGRAHGEPVDRRARVRGQLLLGDGVGRRHQAERRRFCDDRGPARRRERAERVRDGHHRQEHGALRARAPRRAASAAPT
jgi:hypothetical protein